MRRTVNRESDVKALAAVSSWPSSMYAVNVRTLTKVGIAFKINLRRPRDTLRPPFMS